VKAALLGGLLACTGASVSPGGPSGGGAVGAGPPIQGPVAQANGDVISAKSDVEAAPSIVEFEKSFLLSYGTGWNQQLNPKAKGKECSPEENNSADAASWAVYNDEGQTSLLFRVEQAHCGLTVDTATGGLLPLTFIEWFKETDGVPIRVVWASSPTASLNLQYIDLVVHNPTSATLPNVSFEKVSAPANTILEVYLFDTSSSGPFGSSSPTFNAPPGDSKGSPSKFDNPEAYNGFRSDPNVRLLGKFKTVTGTVTLSPMDVHGTLTTY